MLLSSFLFLLGSLNSHIVDDIKQETDEHYEEREWLCFKRWMYSMQYVLKILFNEETNSLIYVQLKEKEDLE